ncbi:MAG: RIP metalloprotease RseP [Myxococcota bacterium]|jgi:regulator of sigma E protease
MEVFDTLVAVIPMLGILIVVHELGHFLVAKACGVRVLKFSIGFGAPIGFGKFRTRWEKNGTEYVIGWIPLGGFVRMLGEPMPGDEEFMEPVPEDARDDEFLERKPVWQKLAVVFAGPAMNLFLPVVCLIGILWNGVDRFDAVVGMVESGSPAAMSGLRPGDRILSVDGSAVSFFEEVIEPVSDREPGGSVLLGVDREGERFDVEVSVAAQMIRNAYGTFEEVGWIGIGNERLEARLGLPDRESAAWEAGLRSGDRVVSVGGTEVEGWEAFREAHAEAAASGRGAGDATVVWQIARDTERVDTAAPATGELENAIDEELIETFEVVLPARRNLASIGVVPATILVAEVSADRPASIAGLRRGDLVLAVDGAAVGSFRSFVSRVQTSAGRELVLTYARDGLTQTTRLAAREEVVAGRYDIEGMEERIYQIGLAPWRTWLGGATVPQQIRNPVESIPQAFVMTWDMTGRYLEGLSRVFTGDVGADKLSGPIGIARIARKSLDRGFEEYLWMMMLISINLGILNLLPIPILDGGQALIYSIEGIKRSPLSMRSREMASSFGFAVLMLLMGRAFWNDLTPFWAKFVNWLSAGTP